MKRYEVKTFDNYQENDSGYWVKYHDVKDHIQQLEADKARLEELFKAAKDYIDESPCDPDIYPEQLAAWQKYQELLKEKE